MSEIQPTRKLKRGDVFVSETDNHPTMKGVLFIAERKTYNGVWGAAIRTKRWWFFTDDELVSVDPLVQILYDHENPTRQK